MPAHPDVPTHECIAHCSPAAACGGQIHSLLQGVTRWRWRYVLLPNYCGHLLNCYYILIIFVYYNNDKDDNNNKWSKNFDERPHRCINCYTLRCDLIIIIIYIYNNRVVAMCDHARGLRGRTDGRAGTSNPAAERRDGL